LVLVEVRVISGAGVVRAWGGCTSPQLEAAAAVCGISLNWEALASGLQATSSRSGRVAGRTVGTGALTLANASADTTRIKTGQRRRIGSKSFFDLFFRNLENAGSNFQLKPTSYGRNQAHIGGQVSAIANYIACYGLGGKLRVRRQICVKVIA
jgi:hypothetical protein